MKYSQKSNPKRHKLIRDHDIRFEAAGTPVINNIDELKDRLQEALVVEHFTIPPYLCALYSIHDGTNNQASRIIRTVVMEEMLHMVMVANILNAIGGTPSIKGENVIPKYPGALPHIGGEFEVNLLRFSKEAINTFLRIEKPAEENIPSGDKFGSIGQFYTAISSALQRLEESAKPGTIFTGDPKKQVNSEHYYGSGGKLIAVKNLEDALEAIDEIVGQGEGIDGTLFYGDNIRFEGDDVDFAHYFRFNEIFHERHYQFTDKADSPPTGDHMSVDWNVVYNMEPNPKMDKYYDNPWLLEKVVAFNRTYMSLLENIHHACNGQPQVLMEGIPLMYKLKQQAVELMKIPSGNGNYSLGPSFEYLAE